MATEKERDLYFAARNRALERHIEEEDLMVEAVDAYRAALVVALKEVPSLNLTHYVSSLKSESERGFPAVCALLTKLEAVKGKAYAASWQKGGELGSIFQNVQRKYDRIDNWFLQGGQSVPARESLTQTLGDAAVYIVKWLVLRAELAPEEFEAWVYEIQAL